MWELSSFVMYALIFRDIWPFIQIFCLVQDKVTLFFNLRMCNKAWEKLVDESENWIEFQVYLVEYLFDQ